MTAHDRSIARIPHGAPHHAVQNDRMTAHAIRGDLPQDRMEAPKLENRWREREGALGILPWPPEYGSLIPSRQPPIHAAWRDQPTNSLVRMSLRDAREVWRFLRDDVHSDPQAMRLTRVLRWNQVGDGMMGAVQTWTLIAAAGLSPATAGLVSLSIREAEVLTSVLLHWVMSSARRQARLLAAGGNPADYLDHVEAQREHPVRQSPGHARAQGARLVRYSAGADVMVGVCLSVLMLWYALERDAIPGSAVIGLNVGATMAQTFARFFEFGGFHSVNPLAIDDANVRQRHANMSELVSAVHMNEHMLIFAMSLLLFSGILYGIDTHSSMGAVWSAVVMGIVGTLLMCVMKLGFRSEIDAGMREHAWLLRLEEIEAVHGEDPETHGFVYNLHTDRRFDWTFSELLDVYFVGQPDPCGAISETAEVSPPDAELLRDFVYAQARAYTLAQLKSMKSHRGESDGLWLEWWLHAPLIMQQIQADPFVNIKGISLAVRLKERKRLRAWIDQDEATLHTWRQRRDDKMLKNV